MKFKLTLLMIGLLLGSLKSFAHDEITEEVTGISILTELDQQPFTKSDGTRLDLVLSVTMKGINPANGEAGSNIYQGIYCQAYNVCKMAGARLVGGSLDSSKSNSCILDNYGATEFSESKHIFSAQGILHFKCVNEFGESVMADKLH